METGAPRKQQQDAQPAAPEHVSGEFGYAQLHESWTRLKDKARGNLLSGFYIWDTPDQDGKLLVVLDSSAAQLTLTQFFENSQPTSFEIRGVLPAHGAVAEVVFTDAKPRLRVVVSVDGKQVLSSDESKGSSARLLMQQLSRVFLPAMRQYQKQALAAGGRLLEEFSVSTVNPAATQELQMASTGQGKHVIAASEYTMELSARSQ